MATVEQQTRQRQTDAIAEHGRGRGDRLSEGGVALCDHHGVRIQKHACQSGRTAELIAEFRRYSRGGFIQYTVAEDIDLPKHIPYSAASEVWPGERGSTLFATRDLKLCEYFAPKKGSKRRPAVCGGGARWLA